jgi:hypothetical protein
MGSTRGTISLYLAKSNGHNGDPDIYEKAGIFRRLRRHHFGAVIALYYYS